MDAVTKKIKAAASGQSKRQAADSLAWFHKHIKTKLAAGIPKTAFSESPVNTIGRMYFFLYDPKHKDTLPWYDKFPLVFPIEFYNDGFLGLNLHYLPPPMRAMLLIKLRQFQKTNKSKGGYLKISYKLLASLSKEKMFSHCIHRYLTSHMQSPFVQVDDEYWGEAAMLPVQQFEKASARKVWSQA